MKKSLISLVPAIVLSCSVHGQSPEPFRVFLNAPTIDTSTVFVELAVSDHMSGQRPITLYKTAPNGGTIVDEKPKRLRHRPQGSMSFTIFPRHRHTLDYQPHMILEINGFATYVSMKAGFGYTLRPARLSFGFFGGKYTRRTNEWGDFKFRAKHFEEGSLWGTYLHGHWTGISAFISLMFEKRQIYHRSFLAWEFGELAFPKGFFRGLRLQLESESLVGTGIGVAIQNPHFGVSCSYTKPDLHERADQRPFGHYLGEGFAVRLAYRFF